MARHLRDLLTRNRWMSVVLVALCLSGCSSTGVYKELDGWLVCENARPQYHAYYDVFYLAPAAYIGTGEYPYAAHDAALEETTRMFGSHVRIFAPIYHDAADIEKALTHYLDTYHGNGLPWPWNDESRPFVIVAEGEGAVHAKDLFRREEKALRKRGYVGSWCSEATTEGFITDETVADIGASVKRVLYLRTWGLDED